MISRFRKESGTQFIQTARELLSHTAFYLDRLPKSMRFIWHVPLVGICRDILHDAISANEANVFSRKNEREELFLKAISELAQLEEEISAIAKNEQWFYCVNGKDHEDDCYPFEEWGRLIDKERNLLRKVIESDQRRSESLAKGNPLIEGGSFYGGDSNNVVNVNSNGNINNNNANNTNNGVAPCFVRRQTE